MKTAVIASVSFSVLYAGMITFQQYVVKTNSFRDFVFWSYLVTLSLTVIYALFRSPKSLLIKSARGWSFGILCGISASVLADSFILIGLQTIPSLNWGILSLLTTPLTFAFAVMWLSERLKVSKILAVLLSIVGALLVVVQSNQRLDLGLGNIWFIAAVLFLTIANIFNQSALRTLTILQLNFIRLLTAVVILGLGLVIFPSHGQIVWWMAVFNGTAILIGMTLISLTIKKAGVAFFSLGSNLVPIFIAIFSLVIYGTRPTPLQIIGGGLIIFSIWLFYLDKIKKANKEAKI